ncbi:udp-n-acetylglucosamine pyrophosphorylase [Vairimorpha apis BRL 01]|uniref:Udp-n-acetylglucosamine pyrophosphorylase n=1 Tax=Vairimorpha apis BRL 01 TaxID=1037528 RepID=T0KWF3_9MICR|nr:udp-n-acetylglucosamine pyrophosphorylase [Vairimorpha apis BRL 01]
MTSEFTHEQIINYFTENENFDLNVNFFKQENSICTFENGEPVVRVDKLVDVGIRIVRVGSSTDRCNDNVYVDIYSVDVLCL